MPAIKPLIKINPGNWEILHRENPGIVEQKTPEARKETPEAETYKYYGDAATKVVIEALWGHGAIAMVVGSGVPMSGFCIGVGPNGRVASLGCDSRRALSLTLNRRVRGVGRRWVLSRATFYLY